jgi:hypothetical protein
LRGVGRLPNPAREQNFAKVRFLQVDGKSCFRVEAGPAD